MLGPALLVAPVFRPDNICPVYLPQGEWIDFHTHEIYQGPANLKLRVPLDKIPLFIRAGSIIPMMKASSRIPEKLISPLIINLYPLKNGKNLYLDDQDSITFHIEKKDDKIVLQVGGRRKRNFVLRFYHVYSFRDLLIEEQEKRVMAGSGDILQKKRFLQVSLNSFKTGKITILLQ